MSKSGFYTARVSQTDQSRAFRKNIANPRKSQQTQANNVTDSKLTNGSIVVHEKSSPSHGSFLGSFNRKKRTPADGTDAMLPTEDSGKAPAAEAN